MATPGSGKSHVIIERAKRLVKEFNENILILTFTNNAVDDLTKKIPSEFNYKITVKTIHSYCLSVLQNNIGPLQSFFGGPEFKELIINENDYENFSEYVGSGLDIEKEYEKIKVLRSFNSPPQVLLNLVKKGVYFKKELKESDVKTFRDYEFHRLSKGYIIFDDLIPLARNLMSLPEVSVPTLSKYGHILVDEAQDTSEDQWEIIRPLIAHCRSSLIVGDVNQSIYEWRGASSNSLLNLGFLNESTIFRMTKSFRNPTVVADLANYICVDKNSKIVSENNNGTFQLREFADQNTELDWVLKNVKLGDVVIARTNSLLEKFEQLLIESKIPYNGSSYQKDPHIIDLVTYCKDHRTDKDLYNKLKSDFLSSRKYTKIEQEDLNYFIEKIKQQGCGFLLRDKYEDHNCVTLATGHSSKGLEWDNVYIIGMNQQSMPHRLVKDEREELNLFYVMITRTRKNLCISYHGEKTKFLTGYVK